MATADQLIDTEKDLLKICELVTNNIKTLKNDTLSGVVIGIIHYLAFGGIEGAKKAGYFNIEEAEKQYSIGTIIEEELDYRKNNGIAI